MRQTQAETDPRPNAQTDGDWNIRILDWRWSWWLVIIRTSHKACFYNFLDHHCLLSGLRHSLSATVRQYFSYYKTSPTLLFCFLFFLHVGVPVLFLLNYSLRLTLKTENNHINKKISLLLAHMATVHTTWTFLFFIIF